MYSHCTGPSPSGGAYCTGNPGGRSTVARQSANPTSAAITLAARSPTTVLTDLPRMGSHLYAHGSSLRGGVGTSTPARRVTGVCAGIALRDIWIRLPSITGCTHGVPAPQPTEH